MLALSPENSATTTVPSSGGNQQIRRTAKPSWNGCDTRHKAYFFACRTPLIVGVSSWAESPNVADNPFPRRRIRRPPLHSRHPCRPLPPAVRAAHRSYPARRVPSPIMALCAYAFQVISKSCRRAFTRRALNVGALEYGAAMLRTSRNHQRQHCHRSKEQREDFSLNDSHAAGRSENSRLLWAAHRRLHASEHSHRPLSRCDSSRMDPIQGSWSDNRCRGTTPLHGNSCR